MNVKSKNKRRQRQSKKGKQSRQIVDAPQHRLKRSTLTEPLHRIDSQPSVETLAVIAASVSQSREMQPPEAVAYALRLWHEASRLLKDEREETELRQVYQTITDEEESQIPCPPHFPATYKDFLKLIVKARTEADNISRYRRFLIHEERFSVPDNTGEVKREQIVKKALERLSRRKQTGFASPPDWISEARSYQEWWREARSETAKINASKRKKPVDQK